MNLNVATCIAHLKSWKRKKLCLRAKSNCDTPLIIQFSLRFRFIVHGYVSGSLHILLYPNMKTSLTSLLYLFISPLLLKRCSYWGHPIGEYMPPMRMELPFRPKVEGEFRFLQPHPVPKFNTKFLFVGS